MAELDASYSKTEAKMADKARGKAKPPLLDISANSELIDRKDCQKCKKKPSLYFCLDYGEVYLCKECNKMTHNAGSKSRKKHKVSELPSLPVLDAKINGVVEPKLIDFESTFELDNVVENGVLDEVTTESFLLVDGSENLQVMKHQTLI